MRAIVTGGAGYIGSFMVKALIDDGHEVVVIDNLESGREESIDKSAKFFKQDIRDEDGLSTIFDKFRAHAILHFAGLISVEESTNNPQIYEDVNVSGSQTLFKTAIKNGIKNFIFSSTAAVYGNPVKIPIPEDHPKNPTSPYGKTKLTTEENLSTLRKENSQVSFACLRYFNASGGALDGTLGESHNPETHIIPLAIRAAMNGTEFKLFGNDYNTPDGTCIRDYIHVLDLVDAHRLALSKIMSGNGEYFYNVGTGIGISNKQVVEKVSEVSGIKMKIENAPKRPGDSDRLVADPAKIKEELGFSPQYSDLETIVKSAWSWHSK